MIFISLIRKIIRLWVRWSIYPKDPLTEIKFDQNIPVVYALQAQSILDFAVTQLICLRYKLPVPKAAIKEVFTDPKRSSFIYVNKLGLFQTEKLRQPSKSMDELIQLSRKHNQPVQIIPISVFWGRNPGKGQKTPILNYFLYGPDSGGLFKRAVQLMLHGRNIFCNIGQPFSSLDPVTAQKKDLEAARMLRRVLRVHFQRQHDSIVGPYLYVRRRVINSMVSSKNVKDLIDRESHKTGQSYQRIEAKARHYADEVVANLSHPAAVVCSRIVNRVTKRVYDELKVFHRDRIRSLAETNNIVFIPSHRSHLDYLLLNFIVYTSGIIPPHTIAGNNLNFWPAGPIVRRGGGIFIRRSFQGNRLYGTMVGEFISYLMSKGFPFCVYTEGGRSRSGLLLGPKTGILSMILEARKVAKKPIVFVPVFISYDNLIESKSYQQELQGKNKKKESFKMLLQSSRILKLRLGTAHFNFGEPVPLDSFFSQHPSLESIGQNADLYGVSKEERNKNNHLIHDLATTLHQKINGAAVISPASLISTLLIASKRNAMSKEIVLNLTQKIFTLFQAVPLTKYVQLPDLTQFKNYLEAIPSYTPIQQFRHPSGDVLHFHEENRGELVYFKNNIQHVFATPALILAILHLKKTLTRNALLEQLSWLYPFTRADLFLEDDFKGLAQKLDHYLQVFQQVGWAEKNLSEPDSFSCPAEAYFPSSDMLVIIEIIASIIDKYALMWHTLSLFVEPPKADEFRKAASNWSRKFSVLNQGATTELFHEKAFKSFLKVGELTQTLNYEDHIIFTTQKSMQCIDFSTAWLSGRYSLT